jgi:hypothetical protein
LAIRESLGGRLAALSADTMADLNRLEPFEKESGIHVNAVKSEVPPAQFELSAKTGSLG